MIYSVLSGTTSVAATASNVQAAITMGTGTDGLLIVNTSADVSVTVAYGTAAQVATLYGGLTLPPGGATVVVVGPSVANVSAIGSAAGPSNVVFTPVKIGFG